VSLTIDDAGPLYLEAVDLYRRLSEAGMFEAVNDDALLADDVMTCDEACRMIGAVVLMAVQLFPALENPETLEQVMRAAALRVTPPNVRD